MRVFLCFFVFLMMSTGVCAAEPTVGAHAAILMDFDSGRVLWEKNSDTALAMASTTKIMTAILALESGRCDETVTVSRLAASAPKMKMYLSSGEKIRLGDLMLALMLESSNDAAVAIAEHLGDDVPSFCAMMTDKAREIGAKDTVFETPNGLDAGDHHSTAHDLALIARYALEVPGFIELTNTQSAAFSSDKRSYSMQNKNRLLHEYSGANGIKTGFTNKAGHCFVGAAKRDDMQLISVVLASGWGDKGRSGKWIDTKAILNYGFDTFSYETIITQADPAGSVAVSRSRSPEVRYIYADKLRLPLSQSEKSQLEIKIEAPSTIPAPIKEGDTIGKANIYLAGQLYTTIELQAAEPATRHDLKTSLEKVTSQWLSQALNEPVQLILPEFPF